MTCPICRTPRKDHVAIRECMTTHRANRDRHFERWIARGEQEQEQEQE